MIVHSYVQVPSAEQATLPVEVKLPAAAPANSYYHNADFTRLHGVLFQDAASKAWRIRFAEANDTNELGGVVTLAGTKSGPSQLQAGMVVNVRGQVFSKPVADGSTEYLADEIEVMAR